MGHVGSIALERAILGIQAGFTQQGSWLSYPTTLCDCVQTGQRLAQEESLFFFKKRTKKLLLFGVYARRVAYAKIRSFLVFFPERTVYLKTRYSPLP
jgi:hypothetical protein